jgi:hypothetical protein
LTWRKERSEATSIVQRRSFGFRSPIVTILNDPRTSGRFVTFYPFIGIPVSLLLNLVMRRKNGCTVEEVGKWSADRQPLEMIAVSRQ